VGGFDTRRVRNPNETVIKAEVTNPSAYPIRRAELGFGESSLDIPYSVWAKREDSLDLRDGLYRQIKEAFDAEGIEIPFPHRPLYSGSGTGPLPVRMVEKTGRRA